MILSNGRTNAYKINDECKKKILCVGKILSLNYI